MKFTEIIDPINNKYDSLDILRNDKVYYLDKYFDLVEHISNNFSIPSSWIYSHESDILKEWIEHNQENLISSFPNESNRWNIKLNKLKKYFDIK